MRWRLAGSSAWLTFAILCTFAVAVGELTQRRIRDDFKEQTAEAADRLQHNFVVEYDSHTGNLSIDKRQLDLVAGSESAVLRIVDQSGGVLRATGTAPRSRASPPPGSSMEDASGVEPRLVGLPIGFVYLQYARP